MSESLSVTEHKQKYSAYVDRVTTQVIAALPLTVADDQLKRARAQFRVAFSADAQGELLNCSAESIARSIVLSALSGLFPGGPRPDVWLIPRKKGAILECNWQLSFRGYVRLARRAGWDMEAVLVYEGEEFKVVEGNRPEIRHVRNLDVEPSWERLRYGYVRVFREGHRQDAKIAYLTKAQIEARRKKAQYDNIWKEWPLEMALKTLCNYAGNREMFPVDDPARYAMAASEQAEIGGGMAPLLSEPATKQIEAADYVAVDFSAAAPEAQTVPVGPVSVGEDLRPPGEAEPPPPSREALVEELRQLLKTHGLAGIAREEPLQSAFGERSWVAITGNKGGKFGPEVLAKGLGILRANLDGLAALKAEAGREPGED